MAEPQFVRQVMRSFGVATSVAAILATVFTAWTPASLSPGEWIEELVALADGRGQTGDLPAEDNLAADGGGLRIGVVAGHSGPHPETGLLDPGATCPDGLTELEVNLTVADLVVRGLQAAGLQADLLEEWDARLTGYRAAALVSIHADSCLVINAEATGYKVAAALDTAVPDKAQRLVACLVDRYGRASELPYHPASITRDMTAYHTFYEIHSQTPAVIIETGFLYLDRDFLTRSPERAARGIVEGILCYIYNEPVSLPGESLP